MKPLLTWNGIPPQSISLMPAQDHLAIMAYSKGNMEERYFDWRNNYPAPIKHFAQTVAAVADSFTAWGATLLSYNRLGHFSKLLKKGETTFTDDANVHEDQYRSLAELQENGILRIRLLWVSKYEPDFIDYTDREGARQLIESYRTAENSRSFKPQIVSQAKEDGCLVRGGPGDIMLFFGGTPHCPHGVLEDEQRDLLDATMDAQLPSDWVTKLQSGNSPKLRL
jgi:hypothetical protein